MSERRRSREPEKAAPCRLCGGLAQPATHFDSAYWGAVKELAKQRMAEVRAEIDEAAKHIHMLATER